MRIAVTGASGLIGGALVPHLRAQGHEVLRLVRRPPGAPDEVTWDPVGRHRRPRRLEGVDAVVHLAGAGVGRPPLDASVQGRDPRLPGPGHRHDRHGHGLDWTSHPSGPGLGVGDRLLRRHRRPRCGRVRPRGATASSPTSCVDWEAAADPAREAGIRVVHPRTGLVVAGRGGVWAANGPSLSLLWPICHSGVGGRLGTGRQWWSFISLRDEVAALAYLLDNLDGPVNLTAPNPVTNAEMIRAMGAAAASGPPCCPSRPRRCSSLSGSSPRRSSAASESCPTACSRRASSSRTRRSTRPWPRPGPPLRLTGTAAGGAIAGTRARLGDPPLRRRIPVRPSRTNVTHHRARPASRHALDHHTPGVDQRVRRTLVDDLNPGPAPPCLSDRSTATTRESAPADAALARAGRRPARRPPPRRPTPAGRSPRAGRGPGRQRPAAAPVELGEHRPPVRRAQRSASSGPRPRGAAASDAVAGSIREPLPATASRPVSAAPADPRDAEDRDERRVAANARAPPRQPRGPRDVRHRGRAGCRPPPGGSAAPTDGAGPPAAPATGSPRPSAPRNDPQGGRCPLAAARRRGCCCATAPPPTSPHPRLHPPPRWAIRQSVIHRPRLRGRLRLPWAPWRCR